MAEAHAFPHRVLESGLHPKAPCGIYDQQERGDEREKGQAGFDKLRSALGAPHGSAPAAFFACSG